MVGALLMAMWFSFGSGAAPGANTTEQEPEGTQANPSATALAPSGVGGGAAATTSVSPSSTGAIVILSPQNAGMDVVVGSVDVSTPTWLVVYELAGNTPTRALGASLFFPENNGKGGVIPLLRTTEANTSYFVGQARDDGDHVFEIHVDQNVVDANGAPVGTTFKTQ